MKNKSNNQNIAKQLRLDFDFPSPKPAKPTKVIKLDSQRLTRNEIVRGILRETKSF